MSKHCNDCIIRCPTCLCNSCTHDYRSEGRYHQSTSTCIVHSTDAPCCHSHFGMSCPTKDCPDYEKEEAKDE